MIRSLLNNESDLIAASMTINTLRHDVVDYLHPIGTETPILVIKRNSAEEYDWLTFFRPFTNQVWYFLLSNCVVLLAAVKLIEVWYLGKGLTERPHFETVVDLVGDFWMLGASYFGRAPADQKRIKSKKALNVLFLVVLLANTIVSMSYRSSLTAELSSRRYRMPFESLQQLLESDYRLE